MDDHELERRRGLANSFRPGAIPAQAIPEPGLVDISAMVVPGRIVKAARTIPAVNNVVKHIPDPKLWKDIRHAKRGITEKGSMAGAGVGLAETAYEEIRNK